MSLPYFPMFPTDFDADTGHLTFAEDGAYNRLLRLSWKCPWAKMPDDMEWIYRRARAVSDQDKALIAAVIGEFFTRTGGKIFSKRLATEWSKSSLAHSKRVLAGSAGGKAKAAHLKDKITSNATAMPKQPEPEPEPYKDREVNLSRSYVPVDACIDHFNATAKQAGWSQVQRITTARRAALSQRIADCGGVDEWRAAIDRAARSPLLTGQNDRGWRADFDWLCKPANFTKLMEGNYDPRIAKGNGQYSSQSLRGPGAGSGTVDAFRAAAARYETGQG